MISIKQHLIEAVVKDKKMTIADKYNCVIKPHLPYRFYEVGDIIDPKVSKKLKKYKLPAWYNVKTIDKVYSGMSRVDDVRQKMDPAKDTYDISEQSESLVKLIMSAPLITDDQNEILNTITSLVQNSIKKGLYADTFNIKSGIIGRSLFGKNFKEFEFDLKDETTQKRICELTIELYQRHQQ